MKLIYKIIVYLSVFFEYVSQIFFHVLIINADNIGDIKNLE